MKRKIQFSVLVFLFCIPEFLLAQFTFQKTYTTVGGATCMACCYTSDGNYVFAGYAYTAGLEGVYLIKINEFGDTIWTIKYETSGLLIAPTSISESVDGKLIIAGMAYYTSSTDFDAFLMNVDSVGNLLSANLLNNSSAISGSDDYAYEVISTPDSGYVLFGICQATIGFAGDAAFVIKFDKNDNINWNKSYQYNYEIEGRSIQQTSDGGYIICGLRESPGVGAGKIYLLKINNLGSIQWSKIIDGPAPSYGEADCIRQTSDNGYIVAGKDEGSHKVFLLKTDSTGNFTWMKTYDSPLPDYVYSLEITKDSGYEMVGRTGHLGSADYFLIKTNSNGDTLLTKHYGTVADEVAYFLHQTLDAGFVIGGYSNNSIYIVKTDSACNSACNMPTIPFSVKDTIGTTLSGSCTPVTLNWTITNPTILISSGGTVSTLCSTVGMKENATSRTFPISPNPSSGNFAITFFNTINEGVIEFYSVLGKRIFTEKIINESKKEIELKNIVSGIYFVKVYDGEKMFTQKIIIQ